MNVLNPWGAKEKSVKSLIVAICVLSLFPWVPSRAATGAAEGIVTWVSVYVDGRVLVFGLTFNNSSCASNGAFIIPADHPQRGSILALVLSAKASGVKLQVTAKTDNCWYPEITPDASTLVSAFPS